MTEWLTLLLLVPAVVVPVVLLVGFAGCDRVFGLEHINTPPPVPVVPAIVSAMGTSGTVITLTWTYAALAADFEFERMKLPERTREMFTAATSPHDDDNNGQGLEPGTDYLYRVRAIGSDGETSDWSSPEPNILGTTLPFETTFALTAEEQARSRDAAGFQASSIVQRIEAITLAKSGTRVRLTLRASSVGDASIANIYISKPDPAPGKDPYDSDSDLTLVSSAVVVPANNSLTVPAMGSIHYPLDAEQPLLIAIDFSATLPSAIKVVDNVVGSEASVYFKVPAAEAANPDRTGFTPVDKMFIIEMIEVG
jgi:hypothetical protein